jgi:hypothetical protein
MRLATSKTSGILSGLALSSVIGLTLHSGDANAATCTFGTLASCSITLNNMQFSNFALTPGSTGINDNDEINITQTMLGFYSVSNNYRLGPNNTLMGTGSFSFTATAINGFEFNKSTVDSSTSASTFEFITALPGFTPSSLLSKGGDSQMADALSSLLTTNVVVSWNSMGDEADDSLVRFTLRQAPAPGPLPLLGAGVAFGFSRRLRRRTNAAA